MFLIPFENVIVIFSMDFEYEIEKCKPIKYIHKSTQVDSEKLNYNHNAVTHNFMIGQVPKGEVAHREKGSLCPSVMWFLQHIPIWGQKHSGQVHHDCCTCNYLFLPC